MSARNALPYSAKDPDGADFLKGLDALAPAWYGLKSGDAANEAQRRAINELLVRALPGDQDRKQYKDLLHVAGSPVVDANDAKAVYASHEGARVEPID